MRKRYLKTLTAGVQETAHGMRPTADEGPNRPLYPPLVRRCRQCDGRTINYYRCDRCVTVSGHKTTETFDESAWGFSG